MPAAWPVFTPFVSASNDRSGVCVVSDRADGIFESATGPNRAREKAAIGQYVLGPCTDSSICDVLKAARFQLFTVPVRVMYSMVEGEVG